MYVFDTEQTYIAVFLKIFLFFLWLWAVSSS